MPKDSSKRPRAGKAADATGAVLASVIDRRSFVKKGGSLLVLGSVACAPDHSGGPNSTGTVRVLLTGLHASATTGGSAVITPAAGGTPLNIDLPASGDQSAEVPVGDYSVTYTPPANHVLAAGQTFPQTVTITVAQTTTVTVNLIAQGGMQVNVTGLTGSPANGGSASAQRTDVSATAVVIPVSAAGTGSATLPSGTYSVTYTPPGGFSASSTNPLTGLVVGLGGNVAANFTVTAAAPTTGTVHVTVTGLTGATQGGSVSAKLTNNTGSTFNGTLSVPSGGNASVDLTSVPAGSYNVTYTPPSGYRTVAGQTNPLVVAVTGGATANAAFTAEVSPPPAGLAFASDWHTATGNTTNAATDGGKWPENYNVSSDRVTVVSASGLSFPAGMANVLAIRYSTSDSLFCGVAIQNGWQLPAVGGVLCRRLYFRHTIDGTDSSTHHPVECYPGNCAYAAEWVVNKGPTFQLQIATLNDGTDFNNGHRWEVTLNRDTTYRVEERYERTATGTWKLHLRIYDSSNTLIKQDADFNCAVHGTHTLASQPNILTPNPDCLRDIMIQNQGVGDTRGSNNTATNRIYYGGMAISLADWCGPYVAGEAG